MQKNGLEWVWRILQEPKLWRRYFGDGVKFLRLIVMNVLPYAIWRIMKKSELRLIRPVTYEISHFDDLSVIALHGNCVYQTINPLREVFRTESARPYRVKLDLSGVQMVDGSFLGLCLMLDKHLNRKGYKLQFTGISEAIRRIFRWNCAEHLL